MQQGEDGRICHCPGYSCDVSALPTRHTPIGDDEVESAQVSHRLLQGGDMLEEGAYCLVLVLLEECHDLFVDSPPGFLILALHIILSCQQHSKEI